MVEWIKSTAQFSAEGMKKSIEKEKGKRIMTKRLTNVDFVEESKLVHCDENDYSKSVYVNKRTKIIIICRKHGEFSMLPHNHYYNGQGCAECSLEIKRIREITKERLENIKMLHKNKYIYVSLIIDKGFIDIICVAHGIFKQSIYIHERGHGCNKCHTDNIVPPMKSKVCKICKVEKNKDLFSKYQKKCQDCFDNKSSPLSKICSKCNKIKDINQFPIRKDSFDGYRNNCSDCFTILSKYRKKIYREKNRVVIREKKRIYQKNRMSNDDLYRAKIYARNIVRKSLSKKGFSKKSKTEKILGCSFIEFKMHIESQFENGMCWSNRNEWHIDHIIPLDFAINEEELIKLNHYLNLRPLYEKENLEKSNIITHKNNLYYEIIKSR